MYKIYQIKLLLREQETNQKKMNPTGHLMQTTKSNMLHQESILNTALQENEVPNFLWLQVNFGQQIKSKVWTARGEEILHMQVIL